MFICWLLCFYLQLLSELFVVDDFLVRVSGVIFPKMFHLVFLKTYGVRDCLGSYDFLFNHHYHHHHHHHRHGPTPIFFLDISDLVFLTCLSQIASLGWCSHLIFAFVVLEKVF